MDFGGKKKNTAHMNHTGKILLLGGAGLVLLGLGLAARSANRTGKMLRVKLLPEKGELSLRRVVVLLTKTLTSLQETRLADCQPLRRSGMFWGWIE